MSYAVAAEPHDTPGLKEAIDGAIIQYNDRAHGPHGWTPLALVIRDEAGVVAGGLWAESFFDWMLVRLLVIPEPARRTGLGTRLMRQAEQAAREAGLVGVWLDTFSFQARPFYEKLGYTCFATLADHPRGGARHFMAKRFDREGVA